MNWLQQINSTHPVAAALLSLSIVAALGLALGRVKVRGISLGIAGVLFAGIYCGHFGMAIEPTVLEFVRDLGLVLFVFTIGLQVGPGFFTSLRREGLPLNLLAAAIILLGAAFTLLVASVWKVDVAAAVGLFSGATTNTPSLGAAQQALKGLALADPSRIELPALGYAVAYPFGIIGIIFSMVFFRGIFRVRLDDEVSALRREQHDGEDHLERMTIEIENENLNGVTIRELPGRQELGIVVSRILFIGESGVHTAKGTMPVHVGDTILAVGTPAQLEKFRLITGVRSSADLMKAPGTIAYRRVVVTKPEALGRTVSEIGFNKVYGVTVTRLARAGIEMPPHAIRLQFGDVLQVVGGDADIERAAQEVGNSIKALNHTNFGAVFVGIAIGVLAGLVPLQLPGVPVPVSLGIAGGPLLAAILLSHFGHIGRIVWYMPENANTALREFGIVLFLACVGLKAGTHFVEVIVRGDGLLWMACASAITLLPLLLVGAFGRLVMKLNFMRLCGLLAGSMTDPPALAFANSTAGSDAPAVAYAAVYPLTMLLRIVVAQLMVIVFVR